jgi:hypothetical protein
MSRRWASKSGELKRLAHLEDDWNLGAVVEQSGRTRARGGGDPNNSCVVPESVVAVSPTGDEDSESSDEETVAALVKKPSHSRVILEVSQLEQAFASYPCPKCNELLELKIRTLCIASSLELICNNKECTCAHTSVPLTDQVLHQFMRMISTIHMKE